MTTYDLQTRLRVHRTIESLKSSGMPYDAMDIADEGLGALGIELPEGEDELRLLEQEVHRVLIDPAWTCPDRHEQEPMSGPVDPFGELEGGRVPTVQLLARRAHSGLGEVESGRVT